jgi:hypothetical protein
MDAFSTPQNRIKTFILLFVCGLLAIAAAVLGIDDNPPGILLAFLAALALILAFVHPWRTEREFLFLLLASIRQPRLRSRILSRVPLWMP